MKKRKRGAVNLFFALALTGFGLSACDDGQLSLQTDFDFAVELLPVPGAVALGEQVEMRFALVRAGGRYDSARYYVRYFQHAGRGLLTDEGGRAFVPNDAYRLPKETFRLYFQPTKGDSHALELVFFDSFNHRHQVDLSFTVEQEGG
jgi:hypothetical protein